jgi:hypothetical protein
MHELLSLDRGVHSSDYNRHQLNKLSVLRQRLAESPELVALVTLLLVFIFFAVSAPNFLTGYPLFNMRCITCQGTGLVGHHYYPQRSSRYGRGQPLYDHSPR